MFDQWTSEVDLTAFGSDRVQALRQLSQVVEVPEGEALTRQFAAASFIWLLQEGGVEFQLQLENERSELAVGSSRRRWTPIGWSGFRLPRRYATTVTTTCDSRLIRFERQALEALFETDPELGTAFLKTVLSGAMALLESSRAQLVQRLKTPFNASGALNTSGEEEAYRRAPPTLAQLLERSSFFEFGDPAEVARLAPLGQSQYFCRGERLFDQGQPARGLYLLAAGQVALNYRCEDEAPEFTVRTLDQPGQVLSFGAGTVERHGVSAVALKDCTLYHISTAHLQTHGHSAAGFALQLARRLLWLTGNQLRSIRALHISREFEQERLAIRNLIEQSCTQLSVHSALHKVPHLLGSPLTLGDAFHTLGSLSQGGSALERSVSHLCLDILSEVRREHDFFEGLRSVYHAVATAPATMEATAVRRLCCEGFERAFSTVRTVVNGASLLPQKPGHIFIFNHLKNHEYNVLPNNFQLTLDSHFVSTLLHKTYGDGGIRVVRTPRGNEYGHQDYYSRLGHISVYTQESDQLQETNAEKQSRRQQFYETAGEYLRQGTNLLLSPEGTSYWTQDSPGPFRPGAFRLAASLTPEPLIVPMAVANFDKRVHSTTLALKVFPPFRVSDVLKDPNDTGEMRAFLKDYSARYARYVTQARALAEGGESVPFAGGEDSPVEGAILCRPA